jgi:hypothetical protein
LLNQIVLDQFDNFLDGNIPNREELTSLIKMQSKKDIPRLSYPNPDTETEPQHEENDEGDIVKKSVETTLCQPTEKHEASDTSVSRTNAEQHRPIDEPSSPANTDGTPLSPFPVVLDQLHPGVVVG